LKRLALACVVAALIAAGWTRSARGDDAKKLPAAVAARIERAQALEDAGRFPEALALYTRLGREHDLPPERRAAYQRYANVLAILMRLPPPFAVDEHEPAQPRDALGHPKPEDNTGHGGFITSLFGGVAERGEQAHAAGRRTRGAGAMITAVRF
jgi:hypothetical protein